MRLSLSGILDADSVPALWKRHANAGALEAIDLGGVSRIDSSGVAFVRLLQTRSRRAGQVPRLENLPGHFTQLQDAHRLQPLDDDHE